MKRRGRVLAGLVLLLAAPAAYLLLWPIPVDPVAWESPVSKGYTGAFAPNDRLAQVERLPLSGGRGPEDAATAPDGRIVASVRDGRIVVVDGERGGATTLADTGGKPLGIEFGPDGLLYVADAYRGLLAVDAATGRVDVLASTDPAGRPLSYVDDLDVAADGSVIFSDASSKFGAEAHGGTLAASLLDILEHGGHGRVFRYRPDGSALELLADGLNFANGIALAPNGDFVLINETGSYRVLRLWLAGPRAGEREVLLDNLPGFPDNLNRAADGTFWLGLVSPRSPALDALSTRPWLRRVVQRLPAAFRPRPGRRGVILRFDADGRVLETLQAPDGSYSLTTGAAEGPDGTLLITSLDEPDLAQLR